MKIYISADIEGVAGVVSFEQTRPGSAEYERARRLMTEEVNAAIEGALEGGAMEVLVNDSHGPMTNLLPELLHPTAELILGKPKLFSMFAGLEDDHALVFCVGYHASAAQFGVLAHTTSFVFRRIHVDGRALGEAGLYGAYAGERNIPVGLISGDDVCIEEHRPLFPGAEFVQVKQALGQRSARNLGIAATRTAIRTAAERATRRAGEIQPFVIERPSELVLDMANTGLADVVATVPVSRRLDATRIAFPLTSMADALRWMSTANAMSAVLG
jgi:D-amino peptidase